MFSCLNKMFYLVKYPWIAYSSTADHNAINPIAIFIFKRFFGRINITVSKNRKMNTGVFFHFSDQGPVSFAFIKLCSCSSVNGNSFYANVLQSFGNFFNILTMVVPAQSCCLLYTSDAADE